MLSLGLTMSVVGMLPSLGGGLPGLPDSGLPSGGGSSGTRPGPPNKGVVQWVGMEGLHIPTEDVDNQKDVIHTATYQAYHGIPAWMQWSTAHFLSNVKIEDGARQLRMACPTDAGDNLPCTFYVVLYNCIPCSTKANGGLPLELINAGFSTGSCGPKYESLFNYEQHKGEIYPTAIYRKQIESGDEVVVDLTKDLLHGAVFELSIAQQCSLKSLVSCDTDDRCQVEDGKCVDSVICPKAFKHGPIQGGPPTKTMCKCMTNPFM